MKTLVIGDTHLDMLYPGYLEAQVDGLAKLIGQESPQRIVFLGDVFNKRKPSPEVLLAFKNLLCGFRETQIDILRGNHDSSTKADNGITALTLFEMLPHVCVHSHFGCDLGAGFSFLPHYEDNARIKALLERVSRDHILFGHFGYTGFRNSFGDCDSDIKITDFRSNSILGHIHEFHEQDKVTLLGTPYQTQFSEYRNKNYIALIQNGVITYKQVSIGPQFHQINYKDIEDCKFSKDRFNIVRILINKYEDNETVNLTETLLAKYPSKYLEIKYYPSFEEEEELSTFNTEKSYTEISNDLICAYIAEAKTDISTEELIRGLEILKNDLK